MLNRRRAAHQLAATNEQVLRFVCDAQGKGHDCVLVFLAGQSASGPRSPGSMMAVLDNADRVGSFSSGCVEAAIAGEAHDVLAAAVPRQVRFGEGSDYIDIRLPCGVGMDLLFLPNPDPLAIRMGARLLKNREPAFLAIGKAGLDGSTSLPATSSPDLLHTVRCTPDLRIVVAGEGAEAEALVRQGRTFGAIVQLLTPDEELFERLDGEGIDARFLDQLSSCPPIEADPWTAIAILFHDHDWEPALIEAALRSRAFWVGAMGSPRTAKRRRALLLERGIGPAFVDQMAAPIGLIPSARDPATLALSTLAEIVAAFSKAGP